MAFLDILLFAAIGAFLGYRLWILLGTHDVDRPIRKRRTEEDDRVVPIRAKATVASSQEKEDSFEEEKPKDVDEDRFLQGATLAFRKIVEAYGNGNLAVLQKLLEGPLLETFEDTIEKRQKAKKVLEIDVARIISTEVINKNEEGGKAYITVRFVSEQCLVTRNVKGKILEGDPDQFTEVTDIWTFSRPLASSDPNWKLIATQIPEE
jgi:predicted lipid-binding transport protein (Tim44 family)